MRMKMRRIILIGAGLAMLAGPALAQRVPTPPGRDGQSESDQGQRGPVVRGPAGAERAGSASMPVAAPPPAAAPDRPVLSMQAVVEIIRRRSPSGQLAGGPTRQGVNYLVRWKAPNGRLIDYVVDAVSGAIRSEE